MHMQAKDDRFVPCENSQELYNQLLYLSDGGVGIASQTLRSGDAWKSLSGAFISNSMTRNFANVQKSHFRTAKVRVG